MQQELFVPINGEGLINMNIYTVIFAFSGTGARIVEMNQQELDELRLAITIKKFQGAIRFGNEFINLGKVSTVRWEIKR